MLDNCTVIQCTNSIIFADIIKMRMHTCKRNQQQVHAHCHLRAIVNVNSNFNSNMARMIGANVWLCCSTCSVTLRAGRGLRNCLYGVCMRATSHLSGIGELLSDNGVNCHRYTLRAT